MRPQLVGTLTVAHRILRASAIELSPSFAESKDRLVADREVECSRGGIDM